MTLIVSGRRFAGRHGPDKASRAAQLGVGGVVRGGAATVGAANGAVGQTTTNCRCRRSRHRQYYRDDQRRRKRYGSPLAAIAEACPRRHHRYGRRR